jgi:hypothetical protein
MADAARARALLAQHANANGEADGTALRWAVHARELESALELARTCAANRETLVLWGVFPTRFRWFSDLISPAPSLPLSQKNHGPHRPFRAPEKAL